MSNVLDTVRDAWPEYGLSSDIRATLSAMSTPTEPFALATIIAAEGGTPRGLGAQMLIGHDKISGYLSGGCIEADVAIHALSAIKDGQPRWLVYGKGGPIDIRLPCGGRVDILVESLTSEEAPVRKLIESTQLRRPVLWVSDGIHRMCGEADSHSNSRSYSDIFKYARAAQQVAGLSNGQIWRAFNPVPRLIIVGRDPAAIALASLARQAGMEVRLVRSMGPTDLPALLEGVDYQRGSPQEALNDLDPWTAVAVMTHDESEDCAALAIALPSRASYVGLLGSRRRLPQRLELLRSAGVNEIDLARLRSPIGLDVGGKSPWEIAVSITAEIMQTMNAKDRAKNSD